MKTNHIFVNLILKILLFSVVYRIFLFLSDNLTGFQKLRGLRAHILLIKKIRFIN